MQQQREDLEKDTIVAGRECGISNVLFRNLIGARLGLNVTDMECLDLLFYRKIASPSELARYTGLSSGATTSMLDRLERGGLITRNPNPNDRRGTIIKIVPEAVDTIAPLFAPIRLAQQQLLAGYSPQELKLIADYFRKSADIWEAGRKNLR
jgi:DNA-binding MarR family transcriptional regulator